MIYKTELFFLFLILGCDNCTQWLLEDLDDITSEFSEIYSDFMTADRILELYKHIDNLNNQTLFLDNALDKYIFLQDKITQIPMEPIHIAHRTALTLKREHLLKKVNDLNNEVINIQKDIDYKIMNIKKITDSILDMIDELDASGTGHIEIRKALEEGMHEVGHIRKIKIPTQEFYNIRKYCKELLNFIKHMKQMNYMHPKDVQQDLDYFRERLNDMKKYIHETFRNVGEVEEHFPMINKRIKSLKHSIQDINDHFSDSSIFMRQQEEFGKAKRDYEDAKQKYDNLMDSVDYFEELLSSVEDKIDESNKENELRRVLIKAKDHADMLVKLARDYNQ